MLLRKPKIHILIFQYLSVRHKIIPHHQIRHKPPQIKNFDPLFFFVDPRTPILLCNKTMQEEHEIDTKIYSYTMAFVMSVIIFVSIIFEIVEHYSMEKSAEWAKPIVTTLFGELSILGFIGLVMFSVTKVGKEYLDNLACNPVTGYFTHDEEACLSLIGINGTHHIPQELLERGWLCLENPLIELTENAHMTLFGVMMSVVLLFFCSFVFSFFFFLVCLSVCLSVLFCLLLLS